jgi:hypothetical protein
MNCAVGLRQGVGETGREGDRGTRARSYLGKRDRRSVSSLDLRQDDIWTEDAVTVHMMGLVDSRGCGLCDGWVAHDLRVQQQQLGSEPSRTTGGPHTHPHQPGPVEMKGAKFTTSDLIRKEPMLPSCFRSGTRAI